MLSRFTSCTVDSSDVGVVRAFHYGAQKSTFFLYIWCSIYFVVPPCISKLSMMACALCVQGKATSKVNPTLGGGRRLGLHSHSLRPLPIDTSCHIHSHSLRPPPTETSRHIQSDNSQSKADSIDGGRDSTVTSPDLADIDLVPLVDAVQGSGVQKHKTFSTKMTIA